MRTPDVVDRDGAALLVHRAATLLRDALLLPSLLRLLLLLQSSARCWRWKCARRRTGLLGGPQASRACLPIVTVLGDALGDDVIRERRELLLQLVEQLHDSDVRAVALPHRGPPSSWQGLPQPPFPRQSDRCKSD